MNNSDNNRNGYLLISLIAVIPVLIWLSGAPISSRFADIGQATTSLGQMAGLIGLSLFALTLHLNTRLKWLENLFHGLDKLFIAHHIFGSFAFIFLLAHPLLLSIQYALFSLSSAAQLLIPNRANGPINFGIFALWLMILCLSLTFYARMKYHHWKFTHQFLGLAFFLASIHVFLIPSDVAIYPPLRWYMLAMLALGIGSFCYRTLFGRYLVKRYPYKVVAVEPINDVTKVTLRPEGEAIEPQAGQFIFVSFHDRPLTREYHPFSLTSRPNDRQISIAAKNSGDYTALLSQMKSGAVAMVEGPYGRFMYKRYGKRQIWVAGGIGITPYISMLKELAATASQYTVDLYYSVVKQEEAIFLTEIRQLTAKLPNFKLHLWVTEKDGYLTADKIKQTTKDLAEAEILLCGPPPMMRALTDQCVKLNIKRRKIHFELFSLS